MDIRRRMFFKKTDSSSGGGDIEVDTTYSIQYTSSDGNIAIPSKTTVFGANITNNVYINGVGYLTFDRSVTSIGNYAFNSCDNLKNVTIPDSVTKIGNSAFYNCDSLTSVNIPDSVTTIGDYAFASCDSLTSVYISDISAWCNISFRGSSSNPLSNGCNLYLNNELVTDLTIPDSVTTIRYAAFGSCDSLTSVNIPDSVTKIGDYAFYDCYNLTSVNIGDGVTSIGYAAFAFCTSLTEFKGKFADDNGRILVIDGVLTAFAPAGITEYNIPDSVTMIGDWAFEGCSSLTSVNIPDSVTKIGDYAFAYCDSLTSVYCEATTPPALGDTYVFYSNGRGRKIYVPTDSVDAYKSATNWSEYADAIVGYNF